MQKSSKDLVLNVTLMVLVAFVPGMGGDLAWSYSVKSSIVEPVSIRKPIPVAPWQLRSSAKKDTKVNWKTYRNETYGFELQHPNDWVPLEGFSLVYPEGAAFPALLRICFGPPNQDKNYCGVELYIIRSGDFTSPTPDSFLGWPRTAKKDSAYHPTFGGVRGIAIETHDPQRPRVLVQNAFVHHGDFVYLLVTKEREATEKFRTFLSMMQSFKFIPSSNR